MFNVLGTYFESNVSDLVLRTSVTFSGSYISFSKFWNPIDLYRDNLPEDCRKCMYHLL
jgi:hypothetical protein